MITKPKAFLLYTRRYHFLLGFGVLLLPTCYTVHVPNTDEPAPDYYNILGVGTDATIGQIQQAYRRLCLQWHPDRNPNNQEEAKAKFKQLQEANEVLSNPIKRKYYDDNGEKPPADIGDSTNAILYTIWNEYKQNGKITTEDKEGHTIPILFEAYKNENVLSGLLNFNMSISDIYDKDNPEHIKERVIFLKNTLNAEKDGKTLAIFAFGDGNTNIGYQSLYVTKNLKSVSENKNIQDLPDLYVNVDHQDSTGKKAVDYLNEYVENKKEAIKSNKDEAKRIQEIYSLLDENKKIYNKVWREECIPPWLRSSFATGCGLIGLCFLYKKNKRSQKSEVEEEI